MGNSGSTNKSAIVAAAAVVAVGLCSLCSCFGSIPNSQDSNELDSVQSSSGSVLNSQDSNELDSVQSSSGSLLNSHDFGGLDSVQSSSGSVSNSHDFGLIDLPSGSVPNSHVSGSLDSVRSSSVSVPNSHDFVLIDLLSGSVPNSQDSNELDSVQSSSGSVLNSHDFGGLDSVQSSSGSVSNSHDFGLIDLLSGSVPNSHVSGSLDSVRSSSVSIPNSHDFVLIDLLSGSVLNSHDSGLIYLPSGSGSSSTGGSGSIGWQFPPMGWIKCNVDGSCRRAQRSAGCGGVYRDRQGKWVNGFARKLDYCSAMKAETLAIFTGLAEAWRLGFRKLIIESDSNSAVDLVNKDVSASHNLALPVKMARKYLRNEWQVNIVYLPREYNRAADWLSKFAHELQVGVHELKKPPTKSLSKILLKDECQAICLSTSIVS